jgi:hypothetical protein
VPAKTEFWVGTQLPKEPGTPTGGIASEPTFTRAQFRAAPRRSFDLFAVALIAPQFTAVPALDAGGRVHLTGAFPTRPLQISFDMTFESVGGQWRLFAISITTPDALQTRPQM